MGIQFSVLSTVEQMYRKGIVEGLTITNLACQPGLCEDCIMGKQSRCPFDGNTHPASEVLKRIHIDFWGPLIMNKCTLYENLI